ncbi:MAG: hypothetical protein ABL982_00160 [Vicinamibacterales bacterium]
MPTSSIEFAPPIPRVCPNKGKPDAPKDGLTDTGVIGLKPCGSTNIKGPFYTTKHQAVINATGVVEKLPMVIRAWFCQDCGENDAMELEGWAPGTAPVPTVARPADLRTSRAR